MLLIHLRIRPKVNNIQPFRHFSKNTLITKPNPNPNPKPDDNFTTFIIVCLIWTGMDITNKFIEYKKNITKK